MTIVPLARMLVDRYAVSEGDRIAFASASVTVFMYHWLSERAQELAARCRALGR